MRRYALAVVFGALHVCQAFRTKTSRAWEGAVVKPVTFQSPETPLQAECSGTMGRSYLLGLLKRLPQHLIESFMIVCSTKKDGDLTDQLDEAVRDLYEKNGDIYLKEDDYLRLSIDASGVCALAETKFDVARDGVIHVWSPSFV